MWRLETIGAGSPWNKMIDGRGGEADALECAMKLVRESEGQFGAPEAFRILLDGGRLRMVTTHSLKIELTTSAKH
jgi:hypothetical protein